MITELRWLRPGEGALTIMGMWDGALSGLGHHGTVFSGAANNRIQHPSRHQEAKRPVRPAGRYGPDTTIL